VVISSLALPKLGVEPPQPEPAEKEFEPEAGPKEFLAREKEFSDGVALSHPG